MNESPLVTLGELSADRTRPAVIRLGEATAVVLDAPTSETVDVWRDGDVFQHAASEPAVAITDSTLWQSTVRRALLSLSLECQKTAADLVADVARNETKLAQVREYAIGVYREGVICHDGLSQFLHAFDLPPYDPRIEVSFSLSGTYDVDGADFAAARTNGESRLVVDIGGICSAALPTLSYTTEILDVTPAEAPIDRPCLRVRYQITGQFRVMSDDVDHAEMDTAATLRADLSAVAGLVPDSATSERPQLQLAFLY